MKCLKVVLVGDGSVGKTCLLCRFTDDKFRFGYEPTVFDMTKHTLNVKHGNVYETVQLELWDTAGQEDYERLRPFSYKDVHVFVLCYSVDSIDSFRNVTDKWLKELREYYPECPSDVPVMLVALKRDLRKDLPHKTIPPSEISKLARRIGTDWYHECSAKDEDDNIEVQTVFVKAAMAALSAKRGQKRRKQHRCIVL